MITISNLAMQFGGSVLFKQVGRSAIYARQLLWHHRCQRRGQINVLKLLSGELEPTSGEIFIKPGARACLF